MSENFSLEEFLHSDTAIDLQIENLPSWEDIDRLHLLASTMETIRSLLGGLPITVSSGFRCPGLNAAVGGVPDSAHLLGYACDFVCPEYGSPTMIVNDLKSYLQDLNIDQLIDESGWVHVGLCDGPARCQCFKV